MLSKSNRTQDVSREAPLYPVFHNKRLFFCFFRYNRDAKLS